MIATSVDEVLALYEQWGADHYDEELSQLAHALQTAALAHADGASDALVGASLLHDVGHLLDLHAGRGHRGDDTDLEHERTGARYLAGLFGPEVTAPIALHVSAKRYRCAVDEPYVEVLSAGSRRSLAIQGGPMTPDEAARFASRPGAMDAVRLREWDDRGKVEGLVVPDLDAHRGLLERLATRP
jgi:phosphonate degradation associated HDIG domain protein